MFLRASAIAAFLCFLLTSFSGAEACPWPSAYKELDNALWASARESGQPARWVQYYTSTGCNKLEAQALFSPIVKSDLPSNLNSYIPDVLKISAKFSGDQSNTIEKFGNGEKVRSLHGGGHVSYLQILSRVDAKNIPKILYDSLTPIPSEQKDVAFWIRYRCGVKGQPISDWYGDPTREPDAQPKACEASTFPGVFDRIEIEFKGPYRNFFSYDNPVLCEKGGEGSVPCAAPGGYIANLTITLKPKHSFLSLLSDGQLAP